ncbi:hypothetical protein EZS27_038345, partial [termite gut metagenome]
GSKFYPLTVIYHPHTDGDILSNGLAFLFSAFKGKNDVSFDVH